MQLTANSFANFLIQDEFHNVAIDQDKLIFASSTSELTVPFTEWNGQIKLERGILWGKLYFYSHEVKGEQTQWLVQGLPWDECQRFVIYANDAYQAWYQSKGQALASQLPDLIETLKILVHQPGYLAYGAVSKWKQEVESYLKRLNIRMSDAVNQLPENAVHLKQWLTNTKQSLELRNQTWLKNELEIWQDYFDHVEDTPLDDSQRQAVLMNCSHNLILGGPGSGKTSVLCARVGYLIQSGQARGEDILLLALSRSSAQFMKQKLQSILGARAKDVQVKTFNQLGLMVVMDVLNPKSNPKTSATGTEISEASEKGNLSSLASDEQKRHQWLSQWLADHWQSRSEFGRWKTHLSTWPIAFLSGDDELKTQYEHPLLLNWLEKQVDQLCALQQTKKQIQQRLAHHPDEQRLLSELELVWPCYLTWQQLLKDNQQLDFHSLVTRTLLYIKQGQYQPKWRFVMLDEVQDMTVKQLELVDAICQKSRPDYILDDAYFSCSLFATGDDCQAVYALADSAKNVTTGAQARYPETNIHYLEKGYRLDPNLVGVSEQFIYRNPNQIMKPMQSVTDAAQGAGVSIGQMKDMEEILYNLDRQIKSSKDKRKAKVILISRQASHQPEGFSELVRRYPYLDLRFMTYLTAKGKEADYVLVLHLDQGVLPHQKRQDHLHDAILHAQDTYAQARERRMLYVAMTRARKQVWLLHGAHPSEFIDEIKSLEG